MTRYALTLSYNGSPFFGFQKQAAGIPTIQTALEHALAQIAGEPIAITAAGRTDTGVHATAQVIHFDSHATRPLTAWVRGVNAHLPDGIAVLHAQAVAPDFHARFDACGRRYRYLLQSAPVRSPLLVGRAGWTHYPLDVAAMHEAAALLLGEHDFSSFRAAECQAKSPVKTVYAVAFSGCPIAPACSPVCSNDGGTATRLGTSVLTAQAASASGMMRARSLVEVCMVFAFWGWEN